MLGAVIPFGHWVRRGVVSLGRELPWAYARMGAALGPRVVALTVDGEDAFVGWRDGAAWVRETLPRGVTPTVTLRTARRTVVALADGDDALVTAVTAGRIVLRGPVHDLVAFHNALMAFLQGAVRAPSFAPTLDAFRAWQQARDAQSQPQESPPRHD